MKGWVMPALFLFAAVQACNRHVPPPAPFVGLPHVEPQPETPIAAPSEPAPVLVSASPVISISNPPPLPPPVAPALTAIEDAGRAFVAGDYTRAINRYEEYLKVAPTGDRRDQALFKLGLIYLLNPQRDWGRAMGHFKELIAQHPTSPEAAEAHFLIQIRTEILQLTADRDKQAELARKLGADLERYKQIDSERLRRVP